MPSLIKVINKKIERRLIEIEDEDLEDTQIERKLDKCRKYLMIGLALVGVLYYIAYEFDGLESETSMVRRLGSIEDKYLGMPQKLQ